MANSSSSTMEKPITSGGLRSSRTSLNGEHGEAKPENGVQIGSLTSEQDAAGGLGRHLGLFSTTLLMLVHSFRATEDRIAESRFLEVSDAL